MSNIPEGFAPFKLAIGFLEANGPLYGKWDGTNLTPTTAVAAAHRFRVMTSTTANPRSRD